MTMTYVDALNIAIETAEEEVAEKLTALRDQIAKKHSSSKPTKRQVENEQIKGEILETLLRAEGRMTVKEITEAIGKEEVTHNRVTALLTQLKKAEKVIREEEKKVAYFSLA